MGPATGFGRFRTFCIRAAVLRALTLGVKVGHANTPARQFQCMVIGLSALGFSRREIARQADISAMTVQRGIVGDMRQPSHDVFQKIQRAWEKAAKPVAK